jgi:hypothetical protein
MDKSAFESEVRRLNPGREDIKVNWVGDVPTFEYSNKLGMPKLPRPKRAEPANGT